MNIIYNETFSPVGLNIYMTIKNILRLDNIEDTDFIRGEIKRVNALQKDLPEENADELDAFMEENIIPIAYDSHYFDFLQKPEFGEYKNGAFVIRDDEALDKLLLLLHVHIMWINAVFDEFAFDKIIFSP